jgi:hypothetical protein
VLRVVNFVIEIVESGVDFFERVIVAVRVVFWRGRDCETTNMVG